MKNNHIGTYARRFGERVFSDYVTPVKGGYRIQSNTSPQGPFQTGSIKRKLSDGHGYSKARRLNNLKVVSTPGGKNTMLMKKFGATQSKSAGKFGKGSRRFKRKRLVRYQKKHGNNHTSEKNGVVTGVDTVWIGHITAPKVQLYKQAVKAIFTRFMNMSGVDVTASNVGFNTIPSGAIISVDYRTRPSASMSTENYTFGAGALTMDDFVNWWLSSLRGWSFVQEAEFRAIYWAGASKSTCELQLNPFLVCFAIKSSLKIQNRSANQVDGRDVTTESDVVPLYGKSYSGSGTYVKTRKPWVNNLGTSNQIVGDTYYGVITPSETDVSMKEPPQGFVEFSNVKAVGKAHLDPGYIKTSVLTDTIKMYFSTLHNLLGSDGVVATTTNRHIGKFRVFCLEKMINTVETYGITIGYEHNYEISCYGYSKRRFGVVKSFEKA